jgi:hypothetical protein
MAGPFIFVGTHRIKEGKLDDFKSDARALARLVEEQEPRLLGFNFFFNDDETETTVVQVHPDADSMLVHMQVAQQHITKGAEELLETKEIQIYGEPNDAVLGMITQLSQSGVTISVKPRHLAGFTRSGTGGRVGVLEAVTDRRSLLRICNRVRRRSVFPEEHRTHRSRPREEDGHTQTAPEGSKEGTCAS